MMLSPYINPSLSSPEECGKMWKDIFALTEFREGDIFCPQDSFGMNTGIDLNEWWTAYKIAADTKPGLKLWANNENFRADDRIARVDEFVKQIKVTAKYAEANVAFSWNHYYSPLESNPGYNKSYAYYVKYGKLETKAPSKPHITVKGKMITWRASDNIGICGLRIYYGKKTKLIDMLENKCYDTSALPKSFKLKKAGTYYISVYDFCGNESSKTKIVIHK